MLPASIKPLLPLALLLLVAACAPTVPAPAPTVPRVDAPPATSTALPPVPEVRGPLVLRVVYPAPGAAVSVRDSSFLFGSTGTGAARLTINGHPVRVWPNGAWLAWIPFPPDSVMRFRLEAATDADSARLEHEVRRVVAGAADSVAVFPRGRVWWPANEYLPLVAHAPEGAVVRIRLPDGALIPLTAHTELEAVPAAVRAFDVGSQPLRAARRVTRYVGLVRGRSIGPDPGPVLGIDTTAAYATLPLEASLADSLWPVVEAIRGLDTARALWPMQLALLDTLPLSVYVDDDTAGLGTTDSITVGRTLPNGTYHWFFPTGTRAAVAGRVNGDLRVSLSPITNAWIAAAEARALPGGGAAQAVLSSLTLRPLADRVVLRLPLSARVPFQVIESDRALALRLYGTVGDADWTRYGSQDSLVRRIGWAQASGGEVTVTVDLAMPVWGYRTRWERNDLVLEIRRPPSIDARDALRGRVIVVDPGHPPAGAVGPTGLREADANLAVALRLRGLLAAAGARVLMTRTTDTAVDLWPRVKFADTTNADLLISIHNNALPDGLNPFTNGGTSVFYNQPRSVPLAWEVQRALLRQLGLRDLGVARGDLALVRATWMPSVLCEGLFIMLPEQEAALRSPEGQARYARGVYDGVRLFLEGRARDR